MPVDERLRRRRPGAGRPTKSPVVGDQKWCPHCEHWKPLDKFSPDSRIKCGHIGMCKPCVNRRNTPNPRQPTGRDLVKRRAMYLRRSFASRSPVGDTGIFESFDPPEIFERDGWICHVCRKPVDRDAAVPNAPSYPTIDHLIAVSLGGIHARGNVRLAHRGCNAVHHHEDRRLRQ